MPLILSGNVASALGGAYEVANSCRFNDGDSPHMTKSSSAGVNDKGTLSVWVKRGVLGTDQNIYNPYTSSNTLLHIYFASDNTLKLYVYDGGSTIAHLVTDAEYRDCSAWMHIVLAIDSDQGTAANRMKLYVNGTQVTSFSSSGYPSSGADMQINNSGTTEVIGRYQDGTQKYFDGYMAEFVWIDGTQYAASDFGEFDSDSPRIWKPKDVSGLTFGTNGFYLDFEDSANLGNDANGGTDLTENNLAAADQATDTPTNNFCTLNPLEAVTATTTYAEGNMQGTTSNAARATFAVSNGKWYWEHKFVNKEAMGGVMAYNGFAPNAYTINALIQGSNPELVLNGTEQSSWSGDGTPDALVDNDILNVALDCDNNRIAFGVNGAWLNATDGSGEWSGTTLNYFSISDGYDYAPAFRTGSGTNRVSHMNFGGCPGFAISSGNADGNGYGNFEYAVPSGFYALCTKNLAEYG